MSIEFKSRASHHDHLLKQQRLVAEFSITGNATPASKTHQVDVGGLMVLRTEGKTTEADAVESLTWTTAVDNSTGDSVFGLLLDLDSNKASKVYSVTLTEVTSVSTSEAVTGPNGGSSFLTSDGNIAIEVAATGLNLASESPTFRVEVEYLEKV